MKTIIVILLFTTSFILHGQDASTVYKNNVNSTVTIETDNGSLGSGFFVAPGIIATNFHVIEGATTANCYLNNTETKYQIEGYLGVDKSIDLILLKVSKLSKPAIKFAPGNATIGQKVVVIGSPKGLSATISEGIVSGMRDFDGYKLIQMTAPISPGSSGGPVLNSNGELLGISVLQIKDGQNLNFAIPKSYLQILLDFKKEDPIDLLKLSNVTANKDVNPKTDLPSSNNELTWHTDMEKAISISQKEKKPIMLFFTGSDWCGWCIKLQKEVFKKPEFVEWAKSNVVLVDVDFPRVNNQSEATKKQNNMLQQQFGVQGYPTCWFVKPEKTKEGKYNLTQLGSQGYLAGGPETWITSAKNIINAKK